MNPIKIYNSIGKSQCVGFMHFSLIRDGGSARIRFTKEEDGGAETKPLFSCLVDRGELAEMLMMDLEWKSKQVKEETPTKQCPKCLEQVEKHLNLALKYTALADKYIEIREKVPSDLL